MSKGDREIRNTQIALMLIGAGMMAFVIFCITTIIVNVVLP